MTDNKNKFIFFESWDRYLDTLEEDRDINYVNAVARAIIKFGLYGDCMTNDESITRRVDAVCADLINSTKSRYANAVAGGKGGRRPTQFDPDVAKQLREQGLTYQEIADQMGCSKKTVQRKLEEDEI